MVRFFARTAKALGIYRSKRALRAFMRASEGLLGSRLGQLALVAASEADCNRFTRDEQRRLAFAALAEASNRTGIDAEDCTLRALLELALHKLRAGEQDQEGRTRAIENFYL